MTQAMLGFLFALAESGLGLGAIVPGEVAISGLAASLDGILPILVLGSTVALGAVAGDHIGYTIGHFSGGRLRESQLVAKLGRDRWDKAAGLMQRHGFWALLASRMLPIVRTVMPLVAGAATVKYRTFLVASIIGAIGWSSVWVGAGAGLAASGALSSPWLYVAAAVVAVTLLARWIVQRRKAGRTDDEDEDEDDAPAEFPRACSAR
jgi:membrane-associated protein